MDLALELVSHIKEVKKNNAIFEKLFFTLSTFTI